jgi:hypothetical protein
MEGVSQPTSRVMTLEHQDPLAACLGEQGSDSQAPDARAHDDGVEGRLVCEPLVAIDHIVQSSKGHALTPVEGARLHGPLITGQP